VLKPAALCCLDLIATQLLHAACRSVFDACCVLPAAPSCLAFIAVQPLSRAAHS
jgi:hypothetical protein